MASATPGRLDAHNARVPYAAVEDAQLYYQDTTADSGLADDLMRAIDAIVKPYNDGQGHSYKGLFDARKQSINANIKLFDKQIEEREFRLEKYEEQLVAKFAALESTMARLNALHHRHFTRPGD